jgi:hypothetical protein
MKPRGFTRRAEPETFQADQQVYAQERVEE